MQASPPSELERLIREHGPFMERLARALTRNAAAADELVSDTWFEALKHGVAAMRSERASLHTVMRRRASRSRRSVRRLESLDVALEQGPVMSRAERPP
ncbi:MAG: sigma factor [Planctomycetota bacterium]